MKKNVSISKFNFIAVAILVLSTFFALHSVRAANPFTQPGGLQITDYTTYSNCVELLFPYHYDENSNATEEYLRRGTLGYSTDGGITWTNLLHFYYPNQNRTDWYYIDMAKVAGNTTDMAGIAPPAGYGSKRAGGPMITATLSSYTYPGDSFSPKTEFEYECVSNLGKTTYVAIRWNYSNIITSISNRAVIFRVGADREGRTTGNLGGLTWDSQPLVIGNPLHTPQINSHEFQADGKIKLNVSIPGFSNWEDKGTRFLGDLLLETWIWTYPDGYVNWIVKNDITPSNANNLSMYYNTPQTMEQFNTGGGVFWVNSTRFDHYATQFTGTHIDHGKFINKRSAGYTIPPYRQPKNLQVTDLDNGKVRITWSMDAGSTGSPTDGFTLQWARSGQSWDALGNSQLINISSITYINSQTSYSVDVDYPELSATGNPTPVQYSFRIKRANLNWKNNGNYYVEKSVNLVPVKAQLTSVDFNTTTKTVSWQTSGVKIPGWTVRVSANGSVIASNININTTSFTYSTMPTCTPTTFLAEIMDGTAVASNLETKIKYTLPNAVIGGIVSCNASKGFYNNRVSILWTQQTGTNFDSYTISRKEWGMPDAVEEQIYSVTPSGSILEYRYDDMTALPGVYYDYILRGWSICNSNLTANDIQVSTGFSLPYGVVNGRIAYEGSVAVEGVTIAVEGNDEYGNKALEFNPNAHNYITIPYKTNMLSPNEFTFQAWVQPRSWASGSRWIISDNTRYEVAVSNTLKVQFGAKWRSGSVSTFPSAASVIDPDQYTHITITSLRDSVAQTWAVKLYLNGILTDSLNWDADARMPIGDFHATDSNRPIYITNPTATNIFDGYMDELRFWKKALTPQEIKMNFDCYISGKEEGLAAYYRFDEPGGNVVYDFSCGANGVYHEHHGNASNTNAVLVRSLSNVPTKEQLAIKGVTNANGHYLINTVPYYGNGCLYTITPMLGVHKFNPSNRPLYFSQNSNTHNNVDFTDVSSFDVSGTVIYEGGTYPVVGCSFEIDGKPVTTTNGELVKTDNQGNFTISVPIGIHSVQVLKMGHTFVNNGFLINEVSGEKLNYNAPINNIKFYDQTRVKLIGRVTGGKIENDKVLGFGESNNNIGAQNIVFNTTRIQYNFVETAVIDTVNHNQGKWKKPGHLSDDQSIVTYNQKDITVKVSPETGEFVAMLYPEPYNIGNISVLGAGNVPFTIYNNNELIDLTNAAVPDMSYMKTNIRTWADSVWVYNKPGVVDHWEYFEKSDTVFYHADWKYYYQATPTFSLTQVVDRISVDYFGDKTFTLQDQLTGDTDILTLYNETTEDYLFSMPVFRQGTIYSFFMKAYEKYTNYLETPEVTVQYPVKYGRVNMSNLIQVIPQPEVVYMDENGEAEYKFMAGAPNLTTGTNDFFATLSLGSISYYWDMGTEPLVAWHLGDKSTGNDFMTAGPNEIITILRDPPGSKSKSFYEKGSTVTVKKNTTTADGLHTVAKFTTALGPKIASVVGIGAAVITESEIKIDASAGLISEEKSTSSTETFTTNTFTERFETSDDPLYVGHYGDIFIGNSTNIIYGLTNAIAIQKDYAGEADAFVNADIGNATYSIAPSVSLALGTTFDTRFVFTTVDIEQIMIPKWHDNLKTLLKAPGTPVNTSAITRPVYVSNLDYDDPNFGKLNTDQLTFGANASEPENFDDGPSYKIFFPDTYNMALFKLDSVMWYNNNINGWIDVLTRNEREKVQMSKLGNYSFGSGASIQYTKTNTTSTTNSSTFSTILNPTTGAVVGANINGIGFELKSSWEVISETVNQTDTIKETVITSGFILQEDGDDDQISVDYGMTASGTMAFKTRGGRTSCPYEAELRTQYFQPGQHILSEGTMQIEVPKIRVESAPIVLNVPANKEAIFMLAMENESETGENVWFELIVDDYTNPNGAILKIDGGIIGNGRLFLVKAGETLHKTLTVSKGTVDKYDNIALILRSQCQSDPTEFWPLIQDITYVSVEFIPGVSDVSITEPTQNWILNADSFTGDTLNVTLSDYDVNFPNFGYIKLEYRPTSSPNWNTIMTFYPSHLFENAQGLKEDIGTRPMIVYPWKTPGPDGPYELRATTASVNSSGGVIIGPPLSTYTTEAVAGYKDVTRPCALGAPSPANGILGIGDELSITFNEDIQTGMLTQNNFSISGVLNAQEIAEPNVGVAFAGTHSAETELPVFTNNSFSIETWFKRNPGTAGTLFAFGSNNMNISLGFNTTGNAIVKIGDETYTSTTAIANDETWKYISMSFNRSDSTVSVYEFEGILNNQLLAIKLLTNTPENQGKLIVGNNFSGNDGFYGVVSQLHFYNITRSQAEAAAGKSQSKSGKEYGLVGYWFMDEGDGNVAIDKARARHLTLNADWYIYPSGYAKQTASDYFDIPTGTYPLNQFSDLTLEFWFRSTGTNQPNQTLFSADNVYIATNATGGLSFYKYDGVETQCIASLPNNITDTKWHHIAMSVRRGGSVNVYVDGVNKATFAETQIGNLSSGKYYFGTKYTSPSGFSDYFDGYFDEIRIWNSALTRESILLNKNSKLRGDEAGLLAYYPFENYIKQSNGLITVTTTNENKAETDNFTAGGTATGFSTISMSVKDVRPVEEVPYTYVASNNKIVFTLANNYFARVEGTTLSISVKDIYDMHNNKSNTEQWTAYIKRNPLLWDADPVFIQMQEGETRSFTARIVNSGGASVSYAIENLPSWLSVNYSAGNLQPLASKDLTFTIFEGINIGNYETAIGLTCGNGVTEILPVQLKVTGMRPDWEVNPFDFEFSMNITGQIKINDTFQEDPDDLLAAFIGDLCVGITSPIYVNSNNAYFTFADIYGNTQHQNQLLKFRLWDASTGRIYPVIETSIPNIVFTPSQILGSTVTPVIFNALDFAEQNIPLKKGWTWISNNVLNDNPSILNQMKTSLTDVGVAIIGRTGYIQQPGWVGTLSEISEKSMYMVNTTENHSLILEGQYANPATTPIPIIHGWNWIGYIPAFTLPVVNALAGLDAQAGDQLKAQVGYATYTGTSWVGSLTSMQAGKGYMYYSNNTMPQTLIYPSTIPISKIISLPSDTSLISSKEITPHWSVDISLYSNSMTVTGAVLLNSVALQSDQIEVGAFSGNECRGSAFLQYVDELDNYLCFLMIYGEGSEAITLKVYNHETATEENANNAPLSFSANLMFGNSEDTYIIAIGNLSADATLSDLTVSEGTLSPEFNSNTYSYTVNVNYDETSIILTATATDANATVTGDGTKTLQVGDNPFTILVTAQNGVTQQTYNITVNRALNTVATLSDLTVSEGTLSPVFNSNTYTYFVNVDGEVASFILTATATDSNATITGDGEKVLTTGANIFTINVIAQDEVTALNYFVVVNCEVGIVETHCNASLLVYPNPTTGELRIEMCDMRHETCDMRYEIYDVYGRKVSSLKSQILNPQIDISHLPAGIYILKVGEEMVKVVKR